MMKVLKLSSLNSLLGDEASAYRECSLRHIVAALAAFATFCYSFFPVGARTQLGKPSSHLLWVSRTT